MLRALPIAVVLLTAGCTTYDDLGPAGAARTGVTPEIGSNETAAAAQITPQQQASALASLNAKADPDRAAAAQAEAADYRRDVASTIGGAARRERDVNVAISRSGNPDTGSSPEQTRREAQARVARIDEKLKKRPVAD